MGRSRRRGAPWALAALSLVAGAGCKVWPDFPEALLDASGRDVAPTDVPRLDAGDVPVPLDGPRDAADVPPSDAPLDAPDPCAAPLPAGPFAFTRFTSGPAGARDLTFDGLGYLVTVAQNVVQIDAVGGGTNLTTVALNGLGLRYLPAGALYVSANPPPAGGPATVRQVNRDGTQALIASGFVSAGYVAVDPSGAAYVTDPTDNAIRRIAPDGMTVTVATRAVASPSGLAFAPGYRRLMVGSPNNSRVFALDVDAAGTVVGTPQAFSDASIPTPAGMAFDRCGNLYVADTGGARVVRVPAAGGAAVEIGAMAGTTPTGVAFGRGAGFDPRALYVMDSGSAAIVRLPVQLEGLALAGPR